MKGVDCVVHLGAIPGEDTWEKILPNNIVGTWNVFEAARRQGVTPRRLCELASRGRLLPARPRHRPERRSAPGWHLRREQGVRRGGRPPVRRQARPLGRVPAHRRVSRQAGRTGACSMCGSARATPCIWSNAASTRPTITSSRCTASPTTRAAATATRTSISSATSRRTRRRTTRPTS